MNILVGVIIGFAVLMLLVVAHEFGHFIAARRNGVEVEEFGIGFPPRAIAWTRETDKNGKKYWQRYPKSEWDKKPGKLVFSINFLPVGGFCSMKGESDSDKRPHSFGSASFWQKTKILFAGVTMNWLVAWVIMTILAWTGMPTFMDNQFSIESDLHEKTGVVLITGIIEDSPAESANLQVGDELKSIDSLAIKNTDDFINYTKEHPGKDVVVTIRRNGIEETHTATLNDDTVDYRLGVYLGQTVLYQSTWSAPIVGAVNTVQLTGETYKGLWSMLASFFDGVVKQFSTSSDIRVEGREEIQATGDSVSGPVGIIGVLFPQSVESGPTTLAFLAALISISLACMNVLPIPALDGGRFFLIALFRIRGKTLTKEIEERVVARAFMFLLGLIVLVTALDIMRLL